MGQLIIKNNFILKQKNGKKDIFNIPKEISNSWENSLSLRERNTKKDINGLRNAQIGAICAIHAHLITNKTESAIIVMPTGSGKTDTMIASIVLEQFTKTIIAVPSALLRHQLAEKCLTLGILKDYKLISEKALFPIVCELKTWPSDKSNLHKLFKSCNIIITTIHLLSQNLQSIDKEIIADIDAFIVDEAHHIAANTWNMTKTIFKENTCLQFSATPYRRDGKIILEKLIYNYPLNQAIAENLFTKIHFHPVQEFNEDKIDAKIAQKALSLLRSDLKKGLKHILLVRTDTIKHAQLLYDEYYNTADNSDLHPILFTSKIPPKDQKNLLSQINKLQTNVIVSVNMFGEGIDIPNLKLAALHNQFKSLPITLQFIGRITRYKADIGEAKLIANLGTEELEPALEELYQEGADWNEALPELSTFAIKDRISFQQLIGRFQLEANEKLELYYLLSNFKPTMSMRVFGIDETAIIHMNNWKKVIEEDLIWNISADNKLFVGFSRAKVNQKWTTVKECNNIVWNYYIIYISQNNDLCFINSSVENIMISKIAKAIISQQKEINPQNFYRVFSSMSRLELKNVGLSQYHNKNISYTQYLGSNIDKGLTASSRTNSSKTSMFGKGYCKNGPETIGVSNKGRIWSLNNSSLDKFLSWAEKCGSQITDSTIKQEDFLKGLLSSETISSIPEEKLIAINFNESLFSETKTPKFHIYLHNQEIDPFNCELNISPKSNKKYIYFNFRYNYLTDKEIHFMYELSKSHFTITNLDQHNNLDIEISNKPYSIEEVFTEYPPIFLFSDFSTLIGNNLLQEKKNALELNFKLSYLKVWDWNKINIRKESYHPKQDNKNCIQYYVYEQIKDMYSIIYLDDGAGEIADIIAMKDTDNCLSIDLYHCKYSSEDNPGCRITDLYELCGQTQTSAGWSRNTKSLLLRIIQRSTMHPENFLKGKISDVYNLLKMSRKKSSKMEINMVQPGLSKNKISDRAKKLLILTESHLSSCWGIESYMICSE